MRCLVTGATGFVGSFLVERLMADGHSVSALVRDRVRAVAQLSSGVTLFEGSAEQRETCRAAVGASRPERVFHLAAQSYPQVSWEDPCGTFRANVLGTLHLLDAVREFAGGSRVLVAGSSAEYAPSAGGEPLAETDRLSPSSPYGVSKLSADFAAGLFAERYALSVVRVRPFFLIGPRKTGDVCSDFARGIVRAERSGERRLRTGNLEIVRDLLDVRDGVEGLLTAIERGEPGGVYNICSGRGYRLREVLDLFKGMSKVALAEETDPALLRPVDEMVKTGDPSRLRGLGWAPRHELRESLAAILEYWRAAA